MVLADPVPAILECTEPVRGIVAFAAVVEPLRPSGVLNKEAMDTSTTFYRSLEKCAECLD